MLNSRQATWEIAYWLSHYHNDTCVSIASRVGDEFELAIELEDYVWDQYGKGTGWNGVAKDELDLVWWNDVAKEFRQYIGKAWPGLLVKGEE